MLHVEPDGVQEVERGDDDIVEVDMHNSCVLVNEMKLKVDLTKYAERHQFNFDESLDEYVSNDQVGARHAGGWLHRQQPSKGIWKLMQLGWTCFAAEQEKQQQWDVQWHQVANKPL